MAIPSSGPISLTTIQTEFGGSNPISLGEYYAGGSYVSSGTSGTYGAVPSSGAIGFRNFYGTSANSYFIIYGGTNYTAANSLNVGGLLVSPQGTVVIGTNDSSAVGQVSYFDNTGAYSISKKFTGAGYPVFVNSASDPTWWFCAPTYGYNTILNSAPGTLIFANGKGGNGQDTIEPGKVAVNSNGVTALSGSYRSGKVDVPTIYLRNSAGTLISARGITANGPRSPQYTKIFAQTDNNFVWIRTKSISEQESWIVSPTSAIPTSNKTYTGGSGPNIDYIYGSIDSSNNTYWVGMSSPYISLLRLNSSRVPTHMVTWDVRTGGYGYNDLINGSSASMTQYGNYVYTCGTVYSGSSPNRVGALLVICLNAADLTFAWGKKFSYAVAGTNTYTGQLGGTTSYSCMGSNQYGVWVKWAAGPSQALSQLYAMKIPLNGSIVNGTYVVNGKDIVIADYTPSLTIETVASTLAVRTPTTTALTDYTLVNPTISAGTTPTNVKTAL